MVWLLFIIGHMGLFFYTKIGSIISIGDLPTTNIIPYTPEMNPIEQVWKEIRKRGFKNKAFQTLEAVIDKLQEVIQGLEKSILKSTVSRQWTRLLFENN